MMNPPKKSEIALPSECCISTKALVERLEKARESTNSSDVMLAFDADGTLWSGDVGNDLFLALIHAQGVRAEAYDALVEEAQTFGIAYSGNATEIAKKLFDAHESGQYPEDRAFAMMAWVFAGMSLDDAIGFSRNVVKETNLESRLHRFLDPVFDWARKENVAVWVVSASAKWMVEIGVAMFGIPAENVIGMMPVIENGFVMSKLAGVPIYGPNKPKVLRAKRPQSILLGGFGDSSYDVPLLQMAKVPVGVRPKSGLIAKSTELSNLAIVGV